MDHFNLIYDKRFGLQLSARKINTTQIKYVTEKLPAGDVSHIKAILTNVLFLSVLTV